MLWKMIQHSFAGGRLDKELMGRQDLAAYFKGASELKNLVVRRQGAVSKRRGTDLCCNLSALGDMTGCRLVPLVYDRDEGFYILFHAVSGTWRMALLSRHGVRKGTVTEGAALSANFERAFVATSYSVDTGIATTVSLDGIDYLQSGDTVFLVHKAFPPKRITFTRSTLTLAVADIDFNSGATPHKVPTVSAATSGHVPTCTTKTEYYKVTCVRDSGESTATAKTVSGLNTLAKVSLTISYSSGQTKPTSYNIYRQVTIDASGTTKYRRIGSVTAATSGYKTTFEDCFCDDPSEDEPPTTGSGTAPSSVSSTILENTLSYSYAATYVKDGAESAISAATSSISVPNGTWNDGTYVAVTVGRGKNTENPDAYRIYRNSGSGFEKIGEVTPTAGQTSVTFSDNNTAEESGSPPNSYGSPKVTLTKSNGSASPAWDSQKGGTAEATYAATAVDAEGRETGLGPTATVSYILPWPNTGKVSVAVSRGTLAETFATDHYNVYKKSGGYFGLIGTVEPGSDGAATFTDDYITPDMTQTPKEIEAHFASDGNYPATVALYQQRLVLCGTEEDPFKFWMSTTGDLTDFNVHASLREDDALSATLPATEMPEINHAVMGRDLILFTSGGEWEVAPVSGNTLSYKTVSAKMQSAIGSARWTKPVTIGDEIVFVDGSGENLLATRYSYASDGYESKDLTVMSRWIFANNGVRRMCYRRSPDSGIVCVLGNGEIAELAYMKEHEVCAWSRHALAGGYLAKDCATSKALSNGSTEVMLLVSNAAGSAWEAWTVRDDVPVRESPAVSDFVCMDRCRAVEVAAGAQGSVDPGETAVNAADATTVAGGSAGAALAAGTWVVGLPFEARLVTVYPEPQGNDTVQMEVKNATEAEVRVVDASTFSVGPVTALGHLREVALAPTAADGVIALRDADVRVPVCGKNTRDGRMAVVHAGPFAFTLTTLNTTYQVEVANRNGGGNGE